MNVESLPAGRLLAVVLVAGDGVGGGIGVGGGVEVRVSVELVFADVCVYVFAVGVEEAHGLLHILDHVSKRVPLRLRVAMEQHLLVLGQRALSLLAGSVSDAKDPLRTDRAVELVGSSVREDHLRVEVVGNVEALLELVCVADLHASAVRFEAFLPRVEPDYTHHDSLPDEAVGTLAGAAPRSLGVHDGLHGFLGHPDRAFDDVGVV